MNLDGVTYSTKPLNLGEHILQARAGKGDFEAMAAYLVSRTDLTNEQVLALDDEECLTVISKIGEAILHSIVLQQIARQL